MFLFADYLKDPAKYRRFNKAALAGHVFAENGAGDMAAGTVVEIEFVGEHPNRLRGRIEPLYRTPDGRTFWASNLTGFTVQGGEA